MESDSGRASWVDRLFVGVAIGLYATDQITKELVTRARGPRADRHSVQVVGDWLRLSYTTNTGAAFGIFPNQPIIFTLIALIAIPTIWTFNRTMSPRTLLTRICLGALLGGALGNVTDRLRLGRVTDFIDAGIGDLRWPAFNVADSSFVVGILTLTLIVFVLEQGRRSKATDDSTGDRRYA
jgi:signal peptidase II